MNEPTSWHALVQRAGVLADTRADAVSRPVLGITGAPGAGKSTLGAALVADLRTSGRRVALVGMDGFHLAQAELERRGRAERKGAPDTFDADGFVILLRRLRLREARTAYAPALRRDLEEPVAASVPVEPGVDLVVTEGNYLLLDDEPWAQVQPLLEECWYLDLPDSVRRERLAKRHQAHGRSSRQAWERALGSDEQNAQLVTACRARADLVVTAPGFVPPSDGSAPH